ncbi:DCC1-like thiol-disulfide oxidoreductase family protein [uncultured Gimesia sp.]|uniref:thiol-disulfide oxidoreductase DCC family protein n=1 Tax=uncultured Gimesia sp. TaxID=1678688 RepID=UPI0030D9A044|tara:strand:- start:75281 stop:75796 length:516 start_codon:yes stop_codon:yes gene_type:complete
MIKSTAVDQTVQDRRNEVAPSPVSPTETQEINSESGAAMDKPVLFFDGVCGLCNSSVDFAMARDRQGRLLYSPLQGETAAALLSVQDIQNIDTVIFRTAESGRLYRRSAAIVRVLWLLGFPWNICGWLLWLIPLPIRNLGYRMVAGSRYRLFGKHETCRMPTPEERTRFLP